MTFMLSVNICMAVELEQVSEKLTLLQALGQVEDVSMQLVPDREVMEAQHVQVSNGVSQVVQITSAPKQRRSRRVADNDGSANVPSHGSGEARPGAEGSPGSDEAGASPAESGPAVVAVGVPEGSAALTVDAHTVNGAGPSANVTPDVTAETVREYCTRAIQTDRSRKTRITAMLGQYGAKAISELGTAALFDFYTHAKKEFGDV